MTKEHASVPSTQRTKCHVICGWPKPSQETEREHMDDEGQLARTLYSCSIGKPRFTDLTMCVPG